MQKTNIEWTATVHPDGTVTPGATWNPIRGCSRVSEGCRNCYAEVVAARFSGPGLPYEGLAADGKWTGKVRLIEDHLADPLRWKKPRRIFVNSMSDLFHEGLKDEEIAAVFGIMVSAPQHTFQVLTKRPARMLKFFEWLRFMSPCVVSGCEGECMRATCVQAARKYFDLDKFTGLKWCGSFWPLPNVWLGVSVEDQKTADERIPLLLQTPAAVRFVSYEPALGPVDFHRLRIGATGMQDALIGHGFDISQPTRESVWSGGARLDWVIVGGESGHAARPFDIAWARKILHECRVSGSCPVFVKQLGARPYEECRVECMVRGDWREQHAASPGTGWCLTSREGGCSRWVKPMPLKDRKGGDMAEWPEDLRVREFPITYL